MVRGDLKRILGSALPYVRLRHARHRPPSDDLSTKTTIIQAHRPSPIGAVPVGFERSDAARSDSPVSRGALPRSRSASREGSYWHAENHTQPVFTLVRRLAEELGWVSGAIFDTTSSMRREGVVGLHTFLNTFSALRACYEVAPCRDGVRQHEADEREVELMLKLRDRRRQRERWFPP
jgi:hypothetical protein